MADPISLIISIIALFISGVTAWLTFFRRGTIKMSQPTIIFFGPDGSRFSSDVPKIYLRTLLFSTSKRGRIIESMYVALSRNETHQTFNIWVYGDDKLVRGSGLFVGETGVATNHHFLTPRDGSLFRFTEGDYRLDVFVRLYGERKHRLLFSQKLFISPDISTQLKEPHTGLYFDWAPSSSQYLSYVDRRELPPTPEDFLKHLVPERSNESTKKPTAEG